MTSDLSSLSMAARKAVVQRDWRTVSNYANAIIQSFPKQAEGYFLLGLSQRATRALQPATESFERAIALEAGRYDAAVELANLYSMQRRNKDAKSLLVATTPLMQNSPRYLDLAGTVYTEIGLSEFAYPLFKRANEIQPGLDIFESNLATCAVYLGKVAEGRKLYEGLIQRNPSHRKNHYQLSRLRKATDEQHILQMKALLKDPGVNDDRNVPILFAIAKELEDLEQWEESFDYYERAGSVVRGITQHRVENDIALIHSIKSVCTDEWYRAGDTQISTDGQQPIFIVGLPRTGTTLVERILSSHTRVSSLGETLFVPMILKQMSGGTGGTEISEDAIQGLARMPMQQLAEQYMSAVSYRSGDQKYVIEKLPFNFLYAGFIAKAWPQAKIINLVRHPMDTCFSMYKQVFTWAYKYSYSLDDLGKYYVAYDELRQHWQSLLGDRFVSVRYEDVVSQQESETRRLLDALGLPFEPECLQFEKNTAPSTTASSVQVRDKVHTESVQKWRRFESQLQPLKDYLSAHGISVD